jgi:chromosome segregation ATPase
MKTKLVLWGKNAQDERVLIALQLRPQDNKVDLWTFLEAIATEDFSQKMLNEWRNGTHVDFPEGFTHSEKELSITENLLPEDLKVERGDLIQRAQTEWHFMVLSSKLNETYQAELQEIKEKVGQLSNYSGEVWEELKGFWSKVQGQVRDRNLFREHANDLRDSTNELFGKMKELRKSLDKEFQSTSEEHMNTFKTGLGEIKERLEKGLNLNGIFEDLKKMQRDFKETRLSRDHRSSIWEQLDGLFKEVKNKRYGGDSSPQGGNSTPAERLKRRYDGLLSALGKMEQSINRDKRELDFQDRKAGQSGGQLEAQLREAKIMMIKERIRSKDEKLNEMLQTKADLEKRIEVQTEKDVRRAEQDKIREAKQEAAQKIKAKIKAEEAARASDDEKLKEAAEKLKGEKQIPEEESIVEKITTEIEETLEDIVDTVKAVAHVVSERIDEAVENFNDPEAEVPEEKTVEAPAEPAKTTNTAAAEDDLKKSETEPEVGKDEKASGPE